MPDSLIVGVDREGSLGGCGRLDDSVEFALKGSEVQSPVMGDYPSARVYKMPMRVQLSNTPSRHTEFLTARVIGAAIREKGGVSHSTPGGDLREDLHKNLIRDQVRGTRRPATDSKPTSAM
eukprot:3517943-Amphidinium_carterae.1